MSSFETAVERVKEVAARLAPRMRLQVQPPFFEDPDYIAALVGSAREYLERAYDHLLFSFHGLPERHLRKSDPTGRHCLATQDCCETASPAHATCYRAQCFKTVAAFVKTGGRARGQILRRLPVPPGPRPLAEALHGLRVAPARRSGASSKLLVMCPAFVSDCLETLEEIGLRGRETFLARRRAEL